VKIEVNGNKVDVAFVDWVTEEVPYQWRSDKGKWLTFPVDYLEIRFDRDTEALMSIYKCIIENNEFTIKYNDKIAKFYITTEELEKVFEQFRNTNKKYITINFVGTGNDI
jgi:hypothetical protein